MFLGYVRDEEHCLALWVALPVNCKGDDYREERALYQLARRQGWTLPRKLGRRQRAQAAREEQRRWTYERWITAWENLPVPIGGARAEQARLRRVAKRYGWDIPPRPNRGQILMAARARGEVAE